MLKIKITNSQTGELQQVVLTPETMAQGECLIGRTANCDLVLDSLDISRIHGKIKYDNNAYHFFDVGSANGSCINYEAIETHQSYPLKPDDTIRMGDFLLYIEAIEIDQVDSSEQKDHLPQQPIGIQEWIKGELKVRCVRVTHETADVKTFTLIAESPVLFRYKPGQFINLDLDIQGETVSRSYSISSTPSRPHNLEITVKRVPAPIDASDAPPGVVSNWLHDNLEVGSLLQISGPLGKFTCAPHPPAKLLLISAGSGITPMMSMARWITDTAAACDVVFFHSTRTPSDIIFRQELELMAARLPNFRFAISTTRAEVGQPWFGLTGRLTAAMLSQIAPDFQHRTVYVCGPNGFMQGTKSLLSTLEFPMEHYHEESFGAPKLSKSPQRAKPPQQMAKHHSPDPAAIVVQSPSALAQPAAIDKAAAAIVTQPLVHFRQSDQEIASDGAESILELAEQAGIRIRSNCRQGVCGSCKKRKLEGEVRYESEPDGLDQEEEAAGFVLTCIACPVGRVVIDA